MDVQIEKERLESVAKHIYGCLILSIAINSEYDCAGYISVYRKSK